MEKRKTKQEKEEKTKRIEEKALFGNRRNQRFLGPQKAEAFCGETLERKDEETSERKEGEFSVSCADKQCPFHGKLKLRGRSFKGFVISKFPRRICIEFERIVYVKKFERYMKKKTKIHARLPDCLKDGINIGDYIEVKECRPLSKIIHFCVVRKIRGAEERK